MTKLFVVGFPREMDEMQLAQLFGPCGDIQLLTIARDKVSGKSKGFGFIQMDDAGATQAITALDGYAFGERKLEVRIAEDNQEPVKKPFNKPKINYVPVTGNPVKKKRPRITK
jgi:RNA recognition motif-containing protein